MPFNWKRKRFDNLIFLFNNQFLSMGKDSSDNILTFKFSSDEVCGTVDLNSTMRINLPDERDSSLCNGEVKTPIRIHVFVKAEFFREMSKRIPKSISERPGESCVMFPLGEGPVWFLVVIVLQKSFTDFF